MQPDKIFTLKRVIAILAIFNLTCIMAFILKLSPWDRVKSRAEILSSLKSQLTSCEDTNSNKFARLPIKELYQSQPLTDSTIGLYRIEGDSHFLLVMKEGTARTETLCATNISGIYLGREAYSELMRTDDIESLNRVSLKKVLVQLQRPLKFLAIATLALILLVFILTSLRKNHLKNKGSVNEKT